MRLTWAIAVVLALASAAWGATTWTAAADANYTNAGNWTNGVAGDGNTVDCSTATMPTANQLAAGTLNFNITNGIAPVYLEDFVNGASIGNVTVSHVGASVNGPEGAGITGSVTLTAGTFYLYGNVSETCSVAAGAELKIMGNTSITGALTSTGTIQFNGSYPLSAPTFATCAGAITGSGTCSLDIESVITCTGALTITGPIDIEGGFNANGQAVTWTGIAAGDTLLCDKAGALNLGNAGGASTAALAATVSASTALGANLRCAALSATGGTFAAGTAPAYTITCASFSLAGATLTGSGLISVGGDLSITNGTNSAHTGNWVLAASGNATNANYANRLRSTLTQNVGVTTALTGNFFARRFDLNGTVTATNYILEVDWAGTDYTTFWGGTGTVGAALKVNNVPSTVGAVTPIVLVNKSFRVAGAGISYSTVIAQPVDIGTGELYIYNGTADKLTTLTVPSVRAGAVVVGYKSPAASGSVLTLTGGPSNIASLARGASTNAGDALNLGSANLFVTGALNGTGITVTPGNGARVKRGGAAATLTAVTATGQRLRTSCAIGPTCVNVAKLVTAGSPGGGL